MRVISLVITVAFLNAAVIKLFSPKESPASKLATHGPYQYVVVFAGCDVGHCGMEQREGKDKTKRRRRRREQPTKKKQKQKERD